MANTADIRVHAQGSLVPDWESDPYVKFCRGLDQMVGSGREDVGQRGPERGNSRGDNVPGTNGKDSKLPDMRTLLVNGKGYKIRGPLSILDEDYGYGWGCLKRAIAKDTPTFGNNWWCWNYLPRMPLVGNPSDPFDSPKIYRFDIEPCGEVLGYAEQEIKIEQLRSKHIFAGLQWSPEQIAEITKTITRANEQLGKKYFQEPGRSKRSKVRLLLG